MAVYAKITELMTKTPYLPKLSVVIVAGTFRVGRGFDEMDEAKDWVTEILEMRPWLRLTRE